MSKRFKQQSSKTDEETITELENIKKTEKENRIRWMTTTIAQGIGREEILHSTLREMLIYIVFLIVVTIYVSGLRNISMFFLSQAFKRQFTNSEFDTNHGGINFDDIGSASDFWFFAEKLLIDKLYWDNFYDDGDLKLQEVEEKNMILYENKLLGVPRIRQVKVTNNSCEIHGYFRRLFLTCYDAFHKDDADKESFGMRKGTAWTYNDAEKTRSLSYWGYHSTYEGGGFYVDFADNRVATEKIILELRNNLWVTRGTRAVFIDFAVYNANVNLFCVCKLIFEFPPSGGVATSHEFQSMKLFRRDNLQDWLAFICQYIHYAMIIFYIAEEAREIFFFKLDYFKQFWNYVDLIVIGLCAASLVVSFRLDQIWIPNEDETYLPEDIRLIRENPKAYGNLEKTASLHLLLRDLTSIMLFLVCIKLFKYLNFNRTMGQLNDTIAKCAWDILGFSVMFFIAFVAFAELGYLIFGTQVDDFSSFGTAMFTLLRTILGDFDYSSIHQSNRVLAPIYFISFIILVFFVLLNMFLAIITDTYSDVKTEILLTQKEMQMTDYIKHNLNKFLKKFGCKKLIMKLEQKKEFNITISKIRDALKKCGFSDIEIEMFFARYDIDTTADISEADIDKVAQQRDKTIVQPERAEDSYVKVRDFVAQEERFEQIEGTIAQLAGRVSELLNTLQELEYVTKKKNV